MFTRSTAFYDAIYTAIGKDYPCEAQQLRALIQEHKRSPGNILLDVACGTGAHLAALQEFYQVEGLELDGGMLEIARQRCPGVMFHQADMADFALGRRFDVVILHVQFNRLREDSLPTPQNATHHEPTRPVRRPRHRRTLARTGEVPAWASWRRLCRSTRFEDCPDEY